MPEGDNIHLHAATLQEQLAGRTVTALWARGVPYPRLAGATITRVEARGKHLLVDIGDAQVHVHLGMSGRLRLGPGGSLAASTGARASLAIATDAVTALWWRAPRVEVLRAAFAHAHPALSALGPDLLADDFEPADAVARARRRPPNTHLGALLLDQRVASGIGNVYKSEVLFLERVDPFATLAAVDDAALTRLYARARTLMQQNLGPWSRTTTRDMTRGGPAPRGDARLHVYRRAGLPCRVCRAIIRAAQQGEPPRTTYWCPACQSSRAGQ
ncbi:MAG TPA: DNA-formamidopyrimidine glycosylase family protein [Polyangia bacterium]|nr:DNA-formamidopyrimidine glycosylase family protein [Polyangia bacterium]